MVEIYGTLQYSVPHNYKRKTLYIIINYQISEHDLNRRKKIKLRMFLHTSRSFNANHDFIKILGRSKSQEASELTFTLKQLKWLLHQ